MSLPYWRRSQVLVRQEVDVLVVGAGVCGLSAALELLGRGLRVAVVDRHHAGAGASGRNAGFLMRGMASNYAQAVGEYGRDLARTMWRWTEENLEINLSRGVGSLPSFRRVPSCLLALEAGELAELRESLRMLHEDGFEAQWLDRGEDSAWSSGRALGGLVNPGDAQVNPWEMVGLLAGPLEGVLVDRQELIALEPGPRGQRVHAWTTTASFLASRVLVCTNAYAPLLFPPLARLVTPHRGQMLAIRPDGNYRLDFSYYANHGSEYFRQTPEGVVVVGGKRKTNQAGEAGYDTEPGEPVQSEIERFARQTLGVSGVVIARWAGTMGFSADGLPIVDRIPVAGVEPDGVWFCGGFTGHGMSLAARTARAAVGQILDGTPTPFGIERFGSGPVSG